jgi:3-deoxy-D-manno-octulosonic-acid transferase
MKGWVADLTFISLTTTFVFFNQITTVHLFFYNIFLLLYSLGIRITALWNPKARLWLNGRKDVWENLKSEVGSRRSENSPQTSDLSQISVRPQTSDFRPQAEGRRPLVWMHSSSLGEFEQGRPVLEQIRKQYPNVQVLLTFFSPSGYEVQKNYPGADYISYLPMDGKVNARKLLNIVQPDLVIWIKYEYWYYYLTELKKQQIPLLLVSGIFRPDQPFFQWYGRLHRYMLESFQHLFVQTSASKRLLGQIGFHNSVTVSGDTRFDRVVQIAEQSESLPLIEAFCGNSKVVVAGSTWPEDEEEMDHYANTHPDIKFIIAPHEIDEEHLQEIEKLFKHTIRFSRWRQTAAAQGAISRRQAETVINTLIIDNIGMLSKLYKYATITYVGGGFGEDGVHNVVEAAVYGKPVVFGPVYEKYVEAVELVQAQGAFVVQTALELEETFNKLFENSTGYQASCQAARNYVYSKNGATDTIMQFIQENRLLTS